MLLLAQSLTIHACSQSSFGTQQTLFGEYSKKIILQTQFTNLGLLCLGVDGWTEWSPFLDKGLGYLVD